MENSKPIQQNVQPSFIQNGNKIASYNYIITDKEQNYILDLIVY